MKYTDVAAFQNHLTASGRQHLAQLYLFIAQECYEVQLCLQTLSKLLFPDATSRELGVVRIQANSETETRALLMQELAALSFFTAHRLVIVEQLDNLSTEQQKTLLPLLEKLPREVSLLFIASSLRSNTTFYKSVEKQGVILDLSVAQKPWERALSMQQWAMAHALEMGKKMSSSVAKLLVSRVGVERVRLHQELLKLVCFMGERQEVQPEDVLQVCENNSVESVWQLCDALFARQAAKALVILKELLLEGHSLFLLIRQIRSQFHIKCHVAALMERGDREAIGAAYSYMRGNILEQTIKACQHYGLAALKKGLILLDQMELQAKNQNQEPEILAELLVVKLSCV